jgi:hypothetical protein
MVDIIHTDSGFYGTAKISGTVDFFPNNGIRVQPGCPLRAIPFSVDGIFSLIFSLRILMKIKRSLKAFMFLIFDSNSSSFFIS